MSEERIVPPTPQRLAAARREGRVARSAGVTTVVALLAAAVTLWFLCQRTFHTLGWFVRQQLASAGGNLEQAQARLASGRWIDFEWLLWLILPLWMCVLIASALANLAQGGWVWAPQRMVPDAARLWDQRRLTAMISLDRTIDVLVELTKLTVCFTVAAWGMWRVREQLVLGQGDLISGVSVVMRAVLGVVLQVLAALGVVSLADYAIQWWRHRQSLRMTAQEWQAEMKERDKGLNVLKTRPFASHTDERAA